MARRGLRSNAAAKKNLNHGDTTHGAAGSAGWFLCAERAFLAFLNESVNGRILWIVPPHLGRIHDYYEDKAAITPLISDGLVEESSNDLPPNCDSYVEYRLNERGWDLFQRMDKRSAGEKEHTVETLPYQ